MSITATASILDPWVLWVLVASVCFILEIFSGALFLLAIGIGCIFSACASALGADLSVQLLIAGLLSVVGVLLVHRYRVTKGRPLPASKNSDVNPDIGQSLNVPKWTEQAEGRYTARVPYRGSHWDIVLRHGDPADPGLHTIVEVIGSTLTVTPSKIRS